MKAKSSKQRCPALCIYLRCYLYLVTGAKLPQLQSCFFNNLFVYKVSSRLLLATGIFGTAKKKC